MKRNTKVRTGRTITHEGGDAIRQTPVTELRRTVMACMLWENTFYEDGQSVADRIKDLVPRVAPQLVSDMAIHAREEQRLRHVPLLIVREMARHRTHRHLVAETLGRIIQRADEITEFMALYWSEGKQPIAASVKHGLRTAFRKFNEYQLAKYNRDGAIKLRDVLFMVHAKPRDDEQAALWKRLVDGTLATPDTWETRLSAGQDKKQSFVELLTQKKLGYMALLRNLRNMHESGVSKPLVAGALFHGAANSKALPFRFIAAARAVPQWEDIIDTAMMAALQASDMHLPGRTLLIVDVSGSMDQRLSDKSDMKRMDAACGLAILLRGVCEDIGIATFSDHLVPIAPRFGMALADTIVRSQTHGGTRLGASLKQAMPGAVRDGVNRVVVITDEQTSDRLLDLPPNMRGYLLNVGTYQNGVGYGRWTTITGFSEACVNFMQELESGAV